MSKQNIAITTVVAMAIGIAAGLFAADRIPNPFSSAGKADPTADTPANLKRRVDYYQQQKQKVNQSLDKTLQSISTVESQRAEEFADAKTAWAALGSAFENLEADEVTTKAIETLNSYFEDHEPDALSKLAKSRFEAIKGADRMHD